MKDNNVKRPKDGLKQIMVIANNPGKNKVQAADKYGIKKYTPSEFLSLIGK